MKTSRMVLAIPLAALIAGSPAMAETTVDGGALAQLAKKMATLTQQLSVMMQISRATNNILAINQQIHSIIGQVGSGTNLINGVAPSQLVSDLSIGLSVAAGSVANRLVGGTLLSLTNKMTTSMSAVEQSASIHSSLAIPTTGNPISDAITESTQDKDAPAATELDKARTNTDNLRARIQANSAALMKSVDQERTGTVLMTDILKLESAHAVVGLPVEEASMAAGPASN